MPNPENLIPHQIKPGEVRNPKGRPKGTGITDKLRKILDDNEGKGAQALADAIYAAALSGDPRIISIVLDRIEGKVTDRLEVDGKMEVVQTYSIAKKAQNADQDDEA